MGRINVCYGGDHDAVGGTLKNGVRVDYILIPNFTTLRKTWQVGLQGQEHPTVQLEHSIMV